MYQQASEYPAVAQGAGRRYLPPVNPYQPITTRSGVAIPNRFAVAPMTNRQSEDDGILREDELEWLAARADSFGLVETCATSVLDDGRGWTGQLGAHDDRHVAGLTRLADAIRGGGAVPMVQLHHGGSQALPGRDRITASITDELADESELREANDADLTAVIDAFVAAALRSERAGFPAVEIHGANGYLFTQFLAPASNRRTDRWGGDLEGRARLLRETVRAVRAALRPETAVAVRISPVDLAAKRGLVLADACRLVQMLAADGIDMVHLSLRDAAAPPPLEPDAPPVVTAIRESAPPDVLVEVAGGVRTRADAERAFAAGADIVAVARMAIVYPDWPTRIADDAFTPDPAPYEPALLATRAVGPRFLTYLERFPGFLVGGAPPRDA